MANFTSLSDTLKNFQTGERELMLPLASSARASNLCHVISAFGDQSVGASLIVLLSSPHYYTGTEEAKFLTTELPFLTCKYGQLCDNVFSLIVTDFITVCFCSLKE